MQPITLPELSKLDTVAQSKIKFACTSILQIQAGEKVLPPKADDLASQYASVGQLLHAYSFLNEAAICYKNAIILDPKTVFTGIIYWLRSISITHDTSAAIKYLREAERVFIALNKTTPDLLQAIYYYLGDAYLSLNQPEQAQIAFEKALQIGNKAIVHWGLGKIALATDPDTSIKHLQNALKLNPNARNTHYSLMMAYNKIGNKRQAALHKAAFEQGSIELSIPDKLMQAVEDLRDSPAALRARGDSALFLYGDYPTAIKLYTNALQLSPNDPSLHLNLGLAKFRTGLVQSSLGSFSNDTLAINPTHSRAMISLGLDRGF